MGGCVPLEGRSSSLLDAHGETISVKGDAPFHIALPSNPTTGYKWFVIGKTSFDPSLTPAKEEDTLPDGLVLVEKKYIPAPATPGLTGKGGDQVFTFKVTGDTPYYLHFFYARTWELPMSAKQKVYRILRLSSVE